jgi:hypothetical protein
VAVITRRGVLRGGLAFGALAALGRRRARAAAYGALVPDPAGVLDLPEGFTYRIVERTGDPTSDGYRVPGAPDAMACFAGDPGTLILLRNHELTAADVERGPYLAGQAPPPEAFDPPQLGGVTRVVVDALTGERLSSNLVLTGTVRNCAGGLSPWGWLTCEESEDPGHGWVFLCPPAADRVRTPLRIAAFGRFRHEAAAVDERTHVAYLTEDQDDGCFYRFVPADPATPFTGRLQALRVASAPNADTAAAPPGTTWSIDWVDVADPDPVGTTVRALATAAGAARVRRGEGLWLDGELVYFSSTTGGAAARGQIFCLDPARATLTILVEGNPGTALDRPDNLTVSPWGDVVIAEDNGGENHLRILGADGALSDFARNATSNSEFCGPCFSPDGRILFVNIQADGLTLAISGPFPDTPPLGDDAGGCC